MAGCRSIFSKKEDYLPLRAGQDYVVTAEYTFTIQDKKHPRFKLQKLTLSNIRSKDFVEFHFFDFFPLKMPVLYVDLIQNVIMEDRHTWNVQQLLHIMQDKLAKAPLPSLEQVKKHKVKGN